MQKNFVFLLALLMFSFIGYQGISGQNYEESPLKGKVLSNDPTIDGIPDELWDQVPIAETQFLYTALEIRSKVRMAYFKSSLFMLVQIQDQINIDNTSKLKVLFDLDQSLSKNEGDLILEVPIFLSADNVTVSRILSAGDINSTVQPNYAKVKVAYVNEIWTIEIQLVTYNDIDTFIARETLLTIFTYERSESGIVRNDSSFDFLENEDLIQTGVWDSKPTFEFPPLDALIEVFHSGIEKITSGANLVKIVTYISIGTSGPIEDIKIVLKTPLPIQAFTGISSEIIANSLLQRYSITVTAQNAPKGGVIRLTYFLDTTNRTADLLTWVPTNISYYNTVGQYRSILVGEDVSLDFSGSRTGTNGENKTSLLSKYNITVVDNQFSLMDLIFPLPFRIIALKSFGILLMAIGLLIFRSWWNTGKFLNKFREKGEYLIITMISFLGNEDPELAKSFARRAYLDLRDSLNRAIYKFRFRAAKLEDLSFHWTEFLNQMERRVKVYYSSHPDFEKGMEFIFSNFDLFVDTVK